MTAYLQSEALGGLHTLLGTLTLARGFMAKSSHKKKENILGRKGYPGINRCEYPNRRKNVEERKLDKLMFISNLCSGGFQDGSEPRHCHETMRAALFFGTSQAADRLSSSTCFSFCSARPLLRSLLPDRMLKLLLSFVVSRGTFFYLRDGSAAKPFPGKV